MSESEPRGALGNPRPRHIGLFMYAILRGDREILGLFITPVVSSDSARVMIVLCTFPQNLSSAESKFLSLCKICRAFHGGQVELGQLVPTREILKNS